MAIYSGQSIFCHIGLEYQQNIPIYYNNMEIVVDAHKTCLWWNDN